MKEERRTVWHGQFCGIPLFFSVCVYGEGFFGWSEYYLIPMMEVKARKKRELSAEPVGKTHRCIPRYIRALGEKHETSTAFNSIHTSLSLSSSFSPSFSLPFVAEKRKKEGFKMLQSTGAVSGGRNGSAQKTHSCASFSSVSKCERMKKKERRWWWWRGWRKKRWRKRRRGEKGVNIPSRVARG